MTTATYDFDTQLTAGEAAEHVLDNLFAAKFEISVVDRASQRSGIDRVFTRRDGGHRLTIEYKTDWTASKTGNAFVETVSVDTASKAGWAYTSRADFLIYYLPDDRLIYVIQFSKLRRRLDRWNRQYRQKAIPNQGYNTVGLLVPLREFEQLATEVISF